CDGVTPVCGACQYREEECQYDQAPSKRKPPSKQYVHALEALVDSLQQQVTQLGGGNSEALSTLQDEGLQTPGTVPSGLLSQRPHMQMTLPVHEMVQSSGSDPDEELATMLGSFNLDEGGELRFFGAASNFHLIRNKETFMDPSSTVARIRGLEAARRTVGLTDTPDELQDHLFDLYWRWQNSWQYVISREVFLADFKDRKFTRLCSPLLVAAINALASRYSDRPELRTDPDDANTSGELYATQTKAMLHHECVAPTIATVQATALLGLYSSGINQESLGWMYSGMAVRMAFTLGLNMDCSDYVSRGLMAPDELEARNVAWWGVYVLDNLFTLGVGRPSTIRDQDVTSKRPSVSGDTVIPISRSTAVTTSLPQVSHVATTAIYTCQLLRIVRMLDTLYAVNPPWNGAEKKRQIIDTHLHLISFQESLPDILKLPASVNLPAMPQVYVFHLQYHVSMILLHRPFFPAFRQASQSIRAQVFEENLHARACRLSAEKICLILRAFKNHYKLRFLPISAAHCAFTAAVIHLLDLTHTDLRTRSKAKHQLSICTDALEEMRETWVWSTRCLKSIQSLAEEWHVDYTNSDNHASPSGELGVESSISLQAADGYNMPPEDLQTGADF
ncbi:C6 transcription factor, partial [Phlyctema vagabunda]